MSKKEKLYWDNNEGLKIEVAIIGERTAYGREELEITPVAGSGSRWIWKENLIRINPDEIRRKTVSKQ